MNQNNCCSVVEDSVTLRQKPRLSELIEPPHIRRREEAGLSFCLEMFTNSTVIAAFKSESDTRVFSAGVFQEKYVIIGNEVTSQSILSKGKKLLQVHTLNDSDLIRRF